VHILLTVRARRRGNGRHPTAGHRLASRECLASRRVIGVTVEHARERAYGGRAIPNRQRVRIGVGIHFRPIIQRYLFDDEPPVTEDGLNDPSVGPSSDCAAKGSNVLKRRLNPGCP